MELTFFTASTLAALSGRPTTDDQAVAIHAWIVAAIEEEIGTLPDPPPPGVAAVALELGRDAVPTPGGAVSTTIGPYSVIYTRTGNLGAGLTRDQRYRLRRAVGQGKPFSIETVVEVE